MNQLSNFPAWMAQATHDLRATLESAWVRHPRLTSAGLVSAVVVGGIVLWVGGFYVRLSPNAAAPQAQAGREQPAGKPIAAATVATPVAAAPSPPDAGRARALQESQAVAERERAARQSQEAAKAQRERELVHLRQQAQNNLDQAAADYDFAAQQWNAELAACQPSQAPGYTPRQRGNFAAMGIRPQPQPQPQRQPNLALLERARQAEQRFLEAQNHHARVMQAN